MPYGHFLTAGQTKMSTFFRFYAYPFSATLPQCINSCPSSGFRALTLASPEVRFHIDSETHDPVDLQTKELK